MTALNPSQIPTTITTVEQLNAWTAIILNDLFPSLTAVEDTGTAARVAQSTPYLVTSGQTPAWRLVSRTSLPVASTWRRSGRLWLSVQEIGTTQIPTEYFS